MQGEIRKVKCEECMHRSVCSFRSKVENFSIANVDIHYPLKMDITCMEYRPELQTPKFMTNKEAK